MQAREIRVDSNSRVKVTDGIKSYPYVRVYHPIGLWERMRGRQSSLEDQAIDMLFKLHQGSDMFANYQIQVHARLANAPTSQEALAQRLDLAMQNPYTRHIVVGRNGSDELLFVSCQASSPDGRDALHDACGFYACKTGQWPDFFTFNCEIFSIRARGTASPDCLEVASRRQMFVLTKKDMEGPDQLRARGKTETKIPRLRRRAAMAKVRSNDLVA